MNGILNMFALAFVVFAVAVTAQTAIEKTAFQAVEGIPNE